jgi:hypothetical protein
MERNLFIAKYISFLKSDTECKSVIIGTTYGKFRDAERLPRTITTQMLDASFQFLSLLHH